MYKQFYNFNRLPFSTGSVEGQYCSNGQHQRVLNALESYVREGRCICVLNGIKNVGKKTLVHALGEKLKNTIAIYSIDVAHLVKGVSLWQEILSGLDVGIETDSKVSLNGRFVALCESGQQGLLVIHGADCLQKADQRTLNLLINHSNLQLLLVSSQESQNSEQVFFPEIADYIIDRYSLKPFSAIETYAFIRVKLDKAGGSRDIFTLPAIKAVYRYSGGFPSLINRICIFALEYGFSRRIHQIDEQVLERVLRERLDLSSRQGQGTKENIKPLPTENTVQPDENKQPEITVSKILATDSAKGQEELPKRQQASIGRRLGFCALSAMAMIAVVGVVGFFVLQNSPGLPMALSMNPVFKSVPAVELSALEQASTEDMLHGDIIRAVVKDKVKTPDELLENTRQSTLVNKQARLILDIEKENHFLRQEHATLVQQRHWLENTLGTQRAKMETLKGQRALARKNATILWNQFNQRTPEAYSESD